MSPVRVLLCVLIISIKPSYAEDYTSMCQDVRDKTGVLFHIARSALLNGGEMDYVFAGREMLESATGDEKAFLEISYLQAFAQARLIFALRPDADAADWINGKDVIQTFIYDNCMKVMSE